jgi:hypothetical protein
VKRVLFVYGTTIGWITCSQCAEKQKQIEVAHLTVDNDGRALLFVADWRDAAALKATFRRRVGAYLSFEIADLPADFSQVTRCKWHGPRTVTVKEVLAARGTTDTPRIAAA